MKLDTLKKKLEAEFSFSEIHDAQALETDPFQVGNILLMPFYKEYQRPWLYKAYNEWLKGGRTIVLITPFKPTCRYFKKYLADVAQIRHINTLSDNNHKFMKPMIIAVYSKRVIGEPNFCVTFN